MVIISIDCVKLKWPNAAMSEWLRSFTRNKIPLWCVSSNLASSEFKYI